MRLWLLVLAAAMAMLSVTRSASAQTPTPEKSSEATQTAPAGKGLSIVGTAWIDAAPAPEGTEVRALVDGVVCGEGIVVSGSASSSSALSFNVNAAAAANKAGCGAIGTAVSFTIAGKPANENLPWDAAAVSSGSIKAIDISAGEPFAAYTGSMMVNGKPVPEGAVLDAGVYDPLHPEIEGTVCGSIVVGKGDGVSKADPSSYTYLPVLPQALKSGCGKEGDKILFRVNGCVIDSADWQPGFHHFDLTRPSLCISAPTSSDDPSASQSEGLTAPSSGNEAESEGPATSAWWLLLAASGLLTLLAGTGLATSAWRNRSRP